MAQKKKRNYRVRYDRIIFTAIILAVLIMLMTSCISSCAKGRRGTGDDLDTLESNETVRDELETEHGGDPVKVETPEIQYENISISSDKLHTGNLILVNTEYPCKFDADEIEEGISADVQFVTIKSVLDTKDFSPKHYTAADYEVGLDRTAAYAMDAWFEAFYSAQNNTDLRMIRGYEPKAGDLDFRAGRTLTIGTYPETGSSNFYKAEGDYAWLQEHMQDYGFILRYPEDKLELFDEDITIRHSATFRYVGIPAATYITEQEICLEEFQDEIKHYSIDSMLEITNGAALYGMYYIPADTTSGKTNFSVPADAVYEVSGNNMDGFIITVALNEAAAKKRNTTPVYEDLDD